MHNLLKIFFRILMAACLTLSVAICWGEVGSQTIQDVIHGLPFEATAICGFALFCIKRFGRLAIYGLAIGIWTLIICLLPTV
jgi:hypothetical protein